MSTPFLDRLHERQQRPPRGLPIIKVHLSPGLIFRNRVRVMVLLDHGGPSHIFLCQHMSRAASVVLLATLASAQGGFELWSAEDMTFTGRVALIPEEQA